MITKIKIYLNYYTGSEGTYKASKRVFKSYKNLYNNLNTFKNVRDITIYKNNMRYKNINGYYNILEFLKNQL